jgi:hypothetical protein
MDIGTGLGMSFVVFLALVIYLLPALIAGGRKHHQQGAILGLNLLLGWTLLGWIAAFVWALTAVQTNEKATPTAAPDIVG